MHEEDALLASRKASSTCKKGMFSNAVRPPLVFLPAYG